MGLRGVGRLGGFRGIGEFAFLGDGGGGRGERGLLAGGAGSGGRRSLGSRGVLFGVHDEDGLYIDYMRINK